MILFTHPFCLVDPMASYYIREVGVRAATPTRKTKPVVANQTGQAALVEEHA